MKKKTPLILIVILLCACCALVAACDKTEYVPQAKPLEWTYFLDEIVDIAVDDLLPTASVTGMELTGDAVSSGKTYKFLFALNLDLRASGEPLMILELTEGDGVFFSVKSNKSETYVDLAPNRLLGNAKLKFENVDIFSWLGGGLAEGNPSEALKEIMGNLGRALFRDVEVNADKTRYSFVLAGENMWTGAFQKYTEALSDMIDPDTLKIIYNLFGAADASEMLGMLPKFAGKIEFVLEDGRLDRIETVDMTSNGEPFGFGLELNVTEGAVPGLSDKYPQGPDADLGYKVTKMGNMSVAGEIALFDADRRAVKFGYELNVNMDILQLKLNGYDLTKLSDDNYIHFRVDHKCSSGCTEFCSSKLGQSRGAVLDIAFSPKDFDTYNLYVDFNFRAVLGENYFDGINMYPSEIKVDRVPEYCILTIPPENFDSDSPLNSLFKLFYSEFMFAESGFELNVVDILSMFDGTPKAYEILEQYFVSEEFSADRMTVSIEENNYWQAFEYDIYKQTVFIIDENLSDLKTYDFYFQSNSDYIALDWKYYTESVTGGSGEKLTLTNIYDQFGNLIHGVSNGNYVPMSANEASGLVGCYLDMSFTKLDKSTVTGKKAKITGIKGLDVDSKLTQEVSLTVEYPNAFEYLYLNKLFEGVRESFTCEVTARIKLTDEAPDGFSFEQPNFDEDKFYRIVYLQTEWLGQGKKPEYLTGIATITYTNGTSKSLVVEGTSESIYKRELFTIGPSWSVVDWGPIKIHFDVANRKFDKRVNIEVPEIKFEAKEGGIASNTEVGEWMNTGNITNYVSMNAYYDGGATRVKIFLLASDLYINGIPLSENSSDWESRPLLNTPGNLIKFKRSNVYQVQIKRSGLESPLYSLTINPKHGTEPEYVFTPNNISPDKVYLEGHTYNFSGSLSNKKHGETANTLKLFTVKLYKGVVSSTGSVSYPDYENASDYLTSPIKLMIGSSNFQVTDPTAGVYCDVPAMIMGTLNISIMLNIKIEGFYRMTFQMAGGDLSDINHSWTFKVLPKQ